MIIQYEISGKPEAHLIHFIERRWIKKDERMKLGPLAEIQMIGNSDART